MPACDRSTRPMPSAIYELDDETLRFFEMPEGTNFELHGAIQHDEMGWWNVEFDPPVIVNWVDLVVLSEELERFISRGSDLPPGTLEQTKSDIKNVEEDIDPADLPDELDMANQAFRAVSKGFGNKDATFKSRLITYLETTFPKLNGTTVDRIATVANPDKARGRRKRELE